MRRVRSDVGIDLTHIRTPVARLIVNLWNVSLGIMSAGRSHLRLKPPHPSSRSPSIYSQQSMQIKEGQYWLD